MAPNTTNPNTTKSDYYSYYYSVQNNTNYTSFTYIPHSRSLANTSRLDPLNLPVLFWGDGLGTSPLGTLDDCLSGALTRR